MAAKRGHREATLALDALRDLFLEHLLPTNRKLRSLQEQPLLHHGGLSDKQVVHWHLEDQLKVKYRRLVAILEDALHANMDHIKHQVLSMTKVLLSSKPEQE